MPVVLYSPGAQYARSLVSEGNVASGVWAFSFEDGTKLLGEGKDDWKNYAKHFLGEDTEKPEDSRERYKYPVAKDGQIFRSALMSVRNRADQGSEAAIWHEAKRLMEGIGPSQAHNSLVSNAQVLQLRGKSTLNFKSTSDTEADIEIFGVIGGNFWDDSGVTKEKFAEQLKGLSSKIQVLNIRLDSPGGDVFDGRSIANMIKQSPYKVNINILGEASSAASIIAMAGSNVHMSEGSLMLIHRCYTIAIGNSIEMAKVSQELNVIDQEAVSTYARRTKMSKEDIISLMDENRYMTASEALEKGFVDSIEAESQASARAGFSIAAASSFLSSQDRDRLHLPPLPENYRPNRKAALATMNRFKQRA